MKAKSEEINEQEKVECTADTCEAKAKEQEVTEEKSENADNSSEEVKQEEETLETRFSKLNDSYLRLMAEYDNYRKRTLKEKSELIRNGGEKTLKDLLPVLDDLDIAMANIDKAEDVQSVAEGVRLIHNKLMDYLKRQGVEPIETKEVAFDEELHEAIATFPAPEEAQKGQVIDCVKKGYTLNDKVLRHASVVVGQ